MTPVGDSTVGAILQCRMGSSRLPGKVLADIGGRPMLLRVVERLQRASTLDRVIVATTDEPADDAVLDLCRRHGVECFRGDPLDVLDRFYRAASRYALGAVARITADCPLADPGVVDRVVGLYRQGGYDYVSNTFRYTYPDGLDVEAFSFSALERAWEQASSSVDREHVTPFIKHGRGFRVLNVESPVDLSSRNLRWTVDEPRDLEFVRAVYSKLEGQRRDFGLEEVLALLDREPHLADLNAGIVRNEGYYRSLAQEPSIPPLVPPARDGRIGHGPVISRASGSHIWDGEGHRYIDYSMADGATILGHGHPAVVEAVAQHRGSTPSPPPPDSLEREVARIVLSAVPDLEAVRFLSGAATAPSLAVGIARAHTQRDLLLCCGVREPGGGRSRSVAYGDAEAVDRALSAGPSKAAAVLVEPTGAPSRSDGEFLRQLRDLTSTNQVLLIFDEAASGFRLAVGGAAEFYGVTPDLTCLGPGIVGGYPLSVLGGRRHLIEQLDASADGVDCEALAATAATIQEARRSGLVEHLWEQGTKLQDGFNVLAEEFGLAAQAVCVGLPPRTIIALTGAPSNYAHQGATAQVFREECLRRGVLVADAHDITLSHSDADIDFTLRVYRSALEVVAATK